MVEKPTVDLESILGWIEGILVIPKEKSMRIDFKGGIYCGRQGISVGYRFSGLIQCLKCGATFRGKMQRNTAVYICSTYNKDSFKCDRYVIKETDLIENIIKHIDIYNNKEIDADFEKYVQEIKVKDGGFRIYYKDGTPESIVEINRLRY